MDTEWMSRGRCRDLDPAVFFPSDWVGVQVAQRICAECTVRTDCLEYALANRVDHGVWGGASERERRRILRSRRAAAAKQLKAARAGKTAGAVAAGTPPAR